MAFYTNSLGEEFESGERAWYYNMISSITCKLATCKVDGREPLNYGCHRYDSTAIAKTPSGALLMLKEYYDKFGYPGE